MLVDMAVLVLLEFCVLGLPLVSPKLFVDMVPVVRLATSKPASAASAARQSQPGSREDETRLYANGSRQTDCAVRAPA
jgi:hypothetical protein